MQKSKNASMNFFVYESSAKPFETCGMRGPLPLGAAPLASAEAAGDFEAVAR